MVKNVKLRIRSIQYELKKKEEIYAQRERPNEYEIIRIAQMKHELRKLAKHLPTYLN